jgi:hypothetical protein
MNQLVVLVADLVRNEGEMQDGGDVRDRDQDRDQDRERAQNRAASRANGTISAVGSASQQVAPTEA